MDIIDKKENLAQVIENYTVDESTKETLMSTISELNQDNEFKRVDLFSNILNELATSLNELSRRELKQRVLLIRSYSGQ